MKRNHKQRIRTTENIAYLQVGEAMTRSTAIDRIQQYLSGASLHPQALRLIEMFHIMPEELSEAGLSYETLKSLEKKALFF